MAIAAQRSNLPFINQSISRQIRSGVFRTKRPLGTATTQAITEGVISQASIDKRQRQAESDRLAESKRQSDQLAQIERERIVATGEAQQRTIEENRRNAEIQAAATKKAAKAAESTFLEGLLGS